MFIGPNRLRAQASGGPLPPSAQSQAPPAQSTAKPKPQEVHPRTTLEGAWKLNRDESDDPRTKAQDSRGTNGGNGGGNPGGGYPRGGGYPGGGAATRAVAILGEATLGAAATLAEVHLVGDKMTAGGTPRMTNGFRN
jgi:hypothetical protein